MWYGNLKTKTEFRWVRTPQGSAQNHRVLILLSSTNHYYYILWEICELPGGKLSI